MNKAWEVAVDLAAEALVPPDYLSITEVVEQDHDDLEVDDVYDKISAILAYLDDRIWDTAKELALDDD